MITFYTNSKIRLRIKKTVLKKKIETCSLNITSCDLLSWLHDTSGKDFVFLTLANSDSFYK